MPGQAPPICQSLLLCDGLHVDPGTGKYFLLGTFSAIQAASFPTVHPQLGIFCELTNGHGRTNVSIKISRIVADRIDGDLIGQLEGSIDFADPRMVSCLAMVLPNVVFPEPGEYRVSVESNGHLLNERKLVLTQRE